MYARTVEMPRGIALIEQRVRSLHNSVGLATSLVTGPVIDHLAARLFLLFGKRFPACSFHLHLPREEVSLCPYSGAKIPSALAVLTMDWDRISEYSRNRFVKLVKGP